MKRITLVAAAVASLVAAAPRSDASAAASGGDAAEVHGGARADTSRAHDSCACADLLESLVVKVETDYPGYRLEVMGSGAAEREYAAHLRDMRGRAATTRDRLDCVALLQDYVAWFRDGHLFVGGQPPLRTAQDSARLAAAAPVVHLDENAVLRYLAENAGRLDPVEGVWVDPAGLKLAILAERAVAQLGTGAGAQLGTGAGARFGTGAGPRFIAFVMLSTDASWRAGDVRAVLEPLPDGSYDAVVYDDVGAMSRPHVYVRGLAGGARLQRGGLLLHMPPLTWGRLHPVPPGHEGRIDVVDPRAPTARLVGEDVVVFHVPSNVPAHALRLYALVEQYRGALGRAETLIIDLRGNEGGSSRTTDALMPFLETARQRPARYLADGVAAVLAAPDNVAYFERSNWAPRGLVERLRNAMPGTLVPFADPAPGQDDFAPATSSQATGRPVTSSQATVPRPRNVAILTDAMTVSAAESFVLKAMRHESVTLFGQPTGSSIDYQTVGIVRFGCADAGLYVGYPTIVGSHLLPAGGVRPTGIVPDVLLPADERDPIARIIEHYQAGARSRTHPRLLGAAPGRDHAVAARVGDHLTEMLVHVRDGEDPELYAGELLAEDVHGRAE